MQKVRSSAPFGTFDIIIVDVVQQLVPVNKTSLIEALVTSLLQHTPAIEIAFETTALFSRVRKFEF